MKTAVRCCIRLYQWTISPFLVWLGGPGSGCRYLPTCSDYASEAISRHGPGRGMALGFARVCRCHPWGQSGFDPVPEVYEGPVWRMKGGDGLDRGKTTH